MPGFFKMKLPMIWKTFYWIKTPLLKTCLYLLFSDTYKFPLHIPISTNKFIWTLCLIIKKCMWNFMFKFIKLKMNSCVTLTSYFTHRNVLPHHPLPPTVSPLYLDRNRTAGQISWSWAGCSWSCGPRRGGWSGGSWSARCTACSLQASTLNRTATVLSIVYALCTRQC